VLISKSLTLTGAGVDSTIIKGPDTKTFDAFGKTYIVEVTGSGVSVNANKLTVAGPSGPGGGLNCAPNPLSLDMGVAVVNDGTLSLYQAAVRNIYDIDLTGNKNSGCQRGDAISVGKPGGPVTPTTGHANVAGVIVDNYQKDGVAVRTTNSTLNLFYNQVSNLPSAVIASNGVEVLDGANGNVVANSVSGNECNLPLICGPSDPINNTQASGILTFAAKSSTVIAGNTVFANDMGIYTDDGIRIAGNQDSNNRASGLYVDTDATKLHATQNITNKDQYGILIGPAFPVSQGGTGIANPGGNFFVNNTAFGNSTTDLYQSPDAGPNYNHDNHCNTAVPSRAYWDCEAQDNDGDEQDNGGGGGGEHGQHTGSTPESKTD
jgi:hypothetical protein